MRMKTSTVEHKPGLPNLPPGWHFSRNKNGSIAVWNDAGGGVVVDAVATADRRMPEEMLHALAVAFGA
jgi:hypothetical protein